LLLAGPKPKPVITPTGLTASQRWKPSNQPRRLLQPIAASPGSHPAPRRVASRVGTPELSRASEAQRWAAKTDKMQKKRDQGRVRPAYLPIALRPRGQLRKGCPERALCLAVKAPCTAKALPWPEYGQGSHLTWAEGGLGAVREAKRSCKSRPP
jgi:hypothetical protein